MCAMLSSGLASVVLLTLMAGTLVAQSAPGDGAVVENEFLKIRSLPDCTIAKSAEPIVSLSKGKYRLVINPMFLHASGVEGGRFSEITADMKSLNAVMAEVDQPAGGFECTAASRDVIFVTKDLSVGNLYTDSSKVGAGCHFPKGGKSVWFGSFSGGIGAETEYTVTFYYDTDDVNELLRRGDPELQRAFREVAEILRTLELKTPLGISSIDPASAAPGEKVALHGHGFRLLGGSAQVRFEEIPDAPTTPPSIDAEGTTLTFEVPSAIEVVSCQEGRIEIGGLCLPIPPGHVDVDDCPRTGGQIGNFCGKPVPPGMYRISVMQGQIISQSLPFTILAPGSTPVSISLIFRNFMAWPGETITVRGSGFTTTGNIVHIGSAAVPEIASTDGKTITFKAPEPEGTSLQTGMRVYKAWVSNTNGESNRVTFGYR